MSAALARCYMATRRPFDPVVPRSSRDPRMAKARLHAQRINSGW
jgi:hypothetical protein